MEVVMQDPDEAMDVMNEVYSPDLVPMTQEDMDEIAELFAFLREEEAA